jgi:uncharacterized membrane protein
VNLKKFRKLSVIAGCIAVFLLTIYLANKDRPTYHDSDTSGTNYEVAEVTKVIEDNTTVDKAEGIWRGSMELEVKILTGVHKGDITTTTNYFSSLYNVRVSTGDKVSVRLDDTEDDYQVSIYNYYRVPALIGCVVAFILLLILIGGKKGAKSVVGLIFTLVCIIWIVLPLALKGISPLMVTIAVILVCNFVSFFLIDGVQKKTVVAAIGSICGVLAGALFAIIAAKIMSVTTYQMDEGETLMLITSTTNLQLKDLFLCGILIACMGAVMDVAMSISSSVAELQKVNPNLKKWDLFKSGMNIGRDAMGTMSNTLILAYAGNSFNMILMIYSYGIGFQQLMNTDFIAIEIIRGIAGTIGIICTVPIVAFIAAAVMSKKNK